ncbi:unnamed protein product [Rotaria socialis]|uniref:Helix-turn-helix domain-containing protein n=2 Tax=Rotaria socialis TaxID=392032 RepID=A0A820SBJ9_9BILA|nr:unnamed protein product [Rotaria socialis]
MAEYNYDPTMNLDLNLDQYKNFDHMEWLEGIFDILDDEDEDDAYGKQQTREDLDDIMEEYNQDFDFEAMNTNLDEEEMFIDDDDDDDKKNVEDRILSQELSELSTEEKYDDEDYLIYDNKRPLSTPSTPDGTSKKMSLWNENETREDQEIDSIFNKFIMDHKNKHTILMSMEDIRTLMILKHRIATSHMEKRQWMIYLKSGTGQWATKESVKTHVDKRVWPLQVKKLITEKMATLNTYEIHNEYTLGEMIVNQHLQELNQKIEEYAMIFNTMKTVCFGWTDNMDEIIDTFVQQHSIVPFAVKLNYKLTLWEYDYDDQLLQREYFRCQPTAYQIEMARLLQNLKFNYLQATQELIEIKKRVLCHRPTSPMLSNIVSSSISLIPTNIDRTVDEQVHKQQQEITESLKIVITEAENKIQECKTLFDETVEQVPIHEDNRNAALTGKLADLIYRRFYVLQKKMDCLHYYRTDLSVRRRRRRGRYNRYDTHNDKTPNTMFRFSPSMIICTSRHAFTDEQLKLLNRGPTYVPPYQTYISSTDQSTIEMIKKNFKLLQHHLTILLTKSNVNMAQATLIIKQIKDAYTLTFSRSLSSSMYQRALYERNLVDTIRAHLKSNDLILRRTADQRNVFYLGNRNDFEDKTNEYMKQTDIFEICDDINDENLQVTRDYLVKKIKAFNDELNFIFHDKKYKDLIEKLSIDTDKVELPYLYFLPDVSQKNNLSVKPIVVTQRSATSRLGQFLDQLLRPTAHRHMEYTTFLNGADFIRKLNEYTTDKEHCIRPTTIFASISISNFHAIVPHKTMLNVFKDFLNDCTIRPFIEDLHINKITHLTALFLYHNHFYYNHKIYRFAKGSPTSLSYTQTLANIYLYQWQKLFSRQASIKNEFFGRCQNQLFFTWNETEDELHALLKMVASQDPNVIFDFEIGRRIPFLEAAIDKYEGELATTIYHNPKRQKYTLPYAINNAKLAHSHWLRSALIRAARYCTSVYEFDFERISLEVACLANGYSLEFVEKRVNHFYTFFDATSLRQSLDQNVYEKLRLRLFNFISEQKLIGKRNQESEKKNERVRLFYLNAFGSKRKFNTLLREILSNYLKRKESSSSSASSKPNEIKILSTAKYQYSLNALLSQQKPNHPLLKKTMTKK